MHSKLEAAEAERREAAAKVEAAKQRTRMMKMPVGLARPLAVSLHIIMQSILEKAKNNF